MEISTLSFLKKDQNYFYLLDEKKEGASIKIIFPKGLLSEYDTELYLLILNNQMNINFPGCFFSYEISPNYTIFHFEVFDDLLVYERIAQLWNSMINFKRNIPIILNSEVIYSYINQMPSKVISNELKYNSFNEEYDIKNILKNRIESYKNRDNLKISLEKTSDYFNEENAYIICQSKYELPYFKKNDFNFILDEYDINFKEDNFLKIEIDNNIKWILINEFLNATGYFHTIIKYLNKSHHILLEINEDTKRSLILTKERRKEIFDKATYIQIMNSIGLKYHNNINKFEYQINSFLNKEYIFQDKEYLGIFKYPHEVFLEDLKEFITEIEAITNGGNL